MMATKATTLFSLTVVKSYVKAQGNSHDAQLTQLADGVSGRIEALTRRKFVTRTVTDETLDGNGKSSVVFPDFPIISISSLSLRWNFWDAFQVVASTDYVLVGKTGTVHLKASVIGGSTFPKAPQSIKATYSAGFDVQDGPALPSDVYGAGLDYVKFLYDRWKSDAVTLGSLNVQGGGSAVLVPDLPRDLKDTLAPYIKRRL